MWGNSAYFWNTVFSGRLLGGIMEMSCPPTITFPVSGVVKPPNIRRVVVLPQPLGPSKVTKLFSLMERFRSSRTSSPSKLFDMCCKSMKGWLMIIKFSFILM